ncbi:MAG: SIS domain-containing protein [Planctomycetaceae bacterium]|jgi:D-sedoheptulose 7-phosphate isomerase|nr:SIS domain-containing protein [Planctomycetaceae bacterium]MBT6484924.1 SIS domain-containing protein [Planctomycetaceae bacterium]MBT6494232.1 SIS domain-containing protein [Planctomycetaceae bacterium]
MLGAELTPIEYLARCNEEFSKLDLAPVEKLAEEIYAAYEDGRFVFICGNGGSGSNSSHLCEDLGKSTLDRKDFTNDSVKRLKVLSLTDNTPYILAWGNDEGFDRVFVEQLKNFASPDDMLIAISGSGNSPNILNAVEWANRHELRTWGITGYTGGQLQQDAQHNLHVPLDDMGMVESIHLLLFHWVLNDVYGRINRVGRHAGASSDAA